MITEVLSGNPEDAFTQSLVGAVVSMKTNLEVWYVVPKSAQKVSVCKSTF